MTDQLLDERTFGTGQEPECEVLARVNSDAEAKWCPGFVRAWLRYEDGWHANVQYSALSRAEAGHEYPANYVATFAPGQVRKAEVPT